MNRNPFGPFAPESYRSPSPDGELARLRERNAELEQAIREATAAPQMVAIVLEDRGQKLLIAIGSSIVEVVNPKHLKLGPGDNVHIFSDSRGVLDVIENPVIAGGIHTVCEVVDDAHVEIAMAQHGNRIVLSGKFRPKKDDRVVLDTNGLIVQKNLGRAGAPLAVDTGVSWDDIGGCADAKRALREAIEAPVRDAGRFDRYRKRRPSGVLLCGPPGTGKTMLAKAAATAIAELHGRASAATGFQYIKGPELLNKFVGESESGVRATFDRARKHFREHGYPAVLCFDEADALLGRRGASRMEGMERTIVPAFLAEMDGIEGTGAFVIVATNRPDTLDPAVVREGRLDLKVLVGRPTQAECADILGRQLSGVPLEGLVLDTAASVGAEQLFDRRHAVYVVRTKTPSKDRRVTLSHWASGSLCAGLVARATTFAMRREQESGQDSGVSSADLAAAAEQLAGEYRILDHLADLEEIAIELGPELVKIDKVKT